MIVFLSSAESEILAVHNALSLLPPGFGKVRCENTNNLGSLQALEAFWTSLPADEKMVLAVRVLGGTRYFDEGLRFLRAAAKARGVAMLALPHHDEPDPELSEFTTVPPEIVRLSLAYWANGDVQNVKEWLCALSDGLLGTSRGAAAPQALPLDGRYALKRVPPDTSGPRIGILFYRAHWLVGDTGYVDSLCEAVAAAGGSPVPVFCYRLKGDSGLSSLVQKYFIADGRPVVDALICALSFAASTGAADCPEVAAMASLGVPILQAVSSTRSRRAWDESPAGLSPREVAMNVAIPEFDGRIITVPFCFREIMDEASPLACSITRYVADPGRTRVVARLAVRFARLRRVPNSEKRVALILSNYPTKNSRIGNAVGLDSLASLVQVLKALKADGYQVGEFPEDGDALVRQLIESGASWDNENVSARTTGMFLSGDDYKAWFSGLPPKAREKIGATWGEAPGDKFCLDGALDVRGIRLGNVFIGVQPPRGFGDNPIAIYHSPDLPPTHHYLGFYLWLREIFRADAVVHMGKHGNLEWLPGKSLGLSENCFPELALAELPLFYPFVVNDPGEGTQAKRRAHAVIVDHLIPPMTTADSYGDLSRLETWMDEYSQMEALDPKKLPWIKQRIWELVEKANLTSDLNVDAPPEDFGGFLQHIDGYLCEIKDSLIRGGLHTFGKAPENEALLDLILALTRLRGRAAPMREAVAVSLGMDPQLLALEPGAPVDRPLPAVLATLSPDQPLRAWGDVTRALHDVSKLCVSELARGQFDPAASREVAGRYGGHPELERALDDVCRQLVPNLRRTTEEIDHLLLGLAGGYVPPGPSGSPTRGASDVLPTGRNFYSIDIQAVPSRAAWEVGRGLAARLLERYVKETGSFPETVGMIVWGTSTMRTKGDDVAEILCLLGVRPVWDESTRRVRGLELIPLEELKRPRIDVTVRISGFFRDAFPQAVALLDQAVRLAARQEEPEEMNFVRKHWLADRRSEKFSPSSANDEDPALLRVFGSKPGSYGAGILQAIDERNWESDEDLSKIYLTWGGYAYTEKTYGRPSQREFGERLKTVSLAVQNQDNREHDIFDSDDYLQFHGGMIASVRALSGKAPLAYFGDSSRPDDPKVRSLSEEAKRVFRARVVNPKWTEGMRRHGYKGAFEMAATVDYMFGYDATAHVVEDWMYEGVVESYVLDETNRAFLSASNPWALKGMAERLLEAALRGLWEKPSEPMLESLRRTVLEVEGDLEGAALERPKAAA
ncbi:MAG: cobaltochelatase subunit CobN [Elusimicrobia bacterium]|nr:cobaltochelatase subunit CobN [Elusimicrobiota bacterium]